MKLANYLKELRVKNGLLQKDLAEKLGYSTPQFISNYERGTAPIPMNVLAKMVEIFKADKIKIFDMYIAEITEMKCKEFREELQKISKKWAYDLKLYRF